MRHLGAIIIGLGVAGLLQAQGNYEVQVYGSELTPKGVTMVELHSNFTVDGSKAEPGSIYAADGTYPTTHQQHETVEITQGLTRWSELGFYLFTSIGPNGQGWQWVGDHIRPRVRAPDSWHWPVGVSISKFLAKLASDLSKPDGFRVVPAEDVRAVLDPLPVSAIYGVGPRTAKRLESMGVTTLADLASRSRFVSSMIFCATCVGTSS